MVWPLQLCNEAQSPNKDASSSARCFERSGVWYDVIICVEMHLRYRSKTETYRMCASKSPSPPPPTIVRVSAWVFSSTHAHTGPTRHRYCASSHEPSIIMQNFHSLRMQCLILRFPGLSFLSNRSCASASQWDRNCTTSSTNMLGDTLTRVCPTAACNCASLELSFYEAA